jgi:hypothetical protein
VNVLQKIEAEERRRGEHVALLQKNNVPTVHGKEEQKEISKEEEMAAQILLLGGIGTEIVMVLKCVLFVLCCSLLLNVYATMFK